MYNSRIFEYPVLKVVFENENKATDRRMPKYAQRAVDNAYHIQWYSFNMNSWAKEG